MANTELHQDTKNSLTKVCTPTTPEPLRCAFGSLPTAFTCGSPTTTEHNSGWNELEEKFGLLGRTHRRSTMRVPTCSVRYWEYFCECAVSPAFMPAPLS